MKHTDRCGDMVPSDLDFESAVGSVVCYCLSSCLLREHQVTVNKGTLSLLNGKTYIRVCHTRNVNLCSRARSVTHAPRALTHEDTGCLAYSNGRQGRTLDNGGR